MVLGERPEEFLARRNRHRGTYGDELILSGSIENYVKISQTREQEQRQPTLLGQQMQALDFTFRPLAESTQKNMARYRSMVTGLSSDQGGFVLNQRASLGRSLRADPKKFLLDLQGSEESTKFHVAQILKGDSELRADVIDRAGFNPADNILKDYFEGAATIGDVIAPLVSGEEFLSRFAGVDISNLPGPLRTLIDVAASPLTVATAGLFPAASVGGLFAGSALRVPAAFAAETAIGTAAIGAADLTGSPLVGLAAGALTANPSAVARGGVRTARAGLRTGQAAVRTGAAVADVAAQGVDAALLSQRTPDLFAGLAPGAMKRQVERSSQALRMRGFEDAIAGGENIQLSERRGRQMQFRDPQPSRGGAGVDAPSQPTGVKRWKIETSRETRGGVTHIGESRMIPVDKATGMRVDRPPAALVEQVGARMPTPGLRPHERLANTFSRVTGIRDQFLNDAVVNPIMQHRTQMRNRAKSVGKLVSLKAQQAEAAFPHSRADGRISNLSGKPTLADVAARLPEYRAQLTPIQIKRMEDLREALAPVGRAMDETGIVIKPRGDVIPGGFYIPRGLALGADFDLPVKRIKSRITARGKEGFEQPIEFVSQRQGVAAGWGYPKPHIAIGGYVEGALNRAIDQWSSAQLNALGDDVTRALRGKSARIDILPGGTQPFAVEVANVANNILKAERGTPSLAYIRALNQVLRGVNATFDVSFLGIQGLLGLATNPAAYARATRTAIMALGDERSLAKYADNFDLQAGRTNRPTAQQWGARGLHVGGPETEFQIGGPAAGKLAGLTNLPGFKQSNRAFGFFGDSLRLDLADTIYRRNWDSLGRRLTTDEMEEIAQIVNKMTGFSDTRFAGDLGELVLFAPRFFQSQIETAAAVMKPGIQGRTARASFLKLIGGAVVATVAANELRGKTTIWDPTDPNFMRILDIGGVDVALLGPWDSFIKMMVRSAQGEFESTLRFKSSPFVSQAWSLFTGENAIGEKVSFDPTSGKPFENFMRSLTPFSVGDIGTESVFATVAGATGLKQTGRSVGERIQAIRGDIYQRLPEDQRRGTTDVDAFVETGRAAIERLQAEASDDETETLRDLNDEGKERYEDEPSSKIRQLARDEIDQAAKDLVDDPKALRLSVAATMASSRFAQEAQETTFGDPETDSGKIFVRWIELFDQADEESEVTGEIVGDVFSRLETEFINDIGETDYNLLMENVYAVTQFDAPEIVKDLQSAKLFAAQTGLWERDAVVWQRILDTAPPEVLKIVGKYDSYAAFRRDLMADGLVFVLANTTHIGEQARQQVLRDAGRIPVVAQIEGFMTLGRKTFEQNYISREYQNDPDGLQQLLRFGYISLDEKEQAAVDAAYSMRAA